ncbi:MAG: hypothetical protein F6K10_13320 [Moorea sp. SIO2B7]|nr:hypothetical protein [Moorena sp. SIO2B7]
MSTLSVVSQGDESKWVYPIGKTSVRPKNILLPAKGFIESLKAFFVIEAKIGKVFNLR